MPAISAKEVIQAASEAIISTLQVQHQSVFSGQTLKVNCFSDRSAEVCVTCLGTLQAAQGEGVATCRGVCECAVEDVDMTASNTVNFKSVQSRDMSTEFASMFESAIKARLYKAKKKNYGALSFGSEEFENLVESTTKIYNEFTSSSVQESLQTASADQTVYQLGPGKMTNVSMAQQADVVSDILQGSTVVQRAAASISNNVESVADKNLQNLGDSLLTIICRLFFILVSIIVYAFLIQQVISLAILGVQ